jgi:hypothetical protein
VTSTPMDRRIAIPRFMLVLGSAPGCHFLHDICHGSVTGRGNVVN